MDYDKKYAQDDMYWGEKPNNLTITALDYLSKKSTILDVGCGEGRDALFLAQKGYEITAIDKSQVGVEKLLSKAKSQNLSLKAVAVDILSYMASCDNYQAILAMHILQFVSEDQILQVIESIKSKTQSGGLNIIGSFIAETQDQKERVCAQGRYFFSEGELKRIYADWNILVYEEKMGPWETHGEPRHRHFLVSLIAQKP